MSYKKQLIFFVPLLLIAIIVTLSILTSKKSGSKKYNNTIVENFTDDLPPIGFMPDYEKTKKTIKPTIDKLQSKDLFKEIIPKQDLKSTRRIDHINQFLQNRHVKNTNKAAGYIVNYPNYEENIIDYSIENIDEYKNLDKNFSAQKVPTTLSSRPVDLSRTLPMTEIIPVILIDEIKSELAGEVVRARIPQNVYAYHGSKILIPAGSTAIGRYKPLRKIGDTRLAINFYRIITPDGINIKLSGFASDQEGAEGLTGKLDNKTKEKFSGAGLAALIQAMAQLSIDVNNQQQAAAAGAISQPISEVVTQVISQSINIAPTLRIPKGSTFNIKFASDIWFPEPVERVINTVAL